MNVAFLIDGSRSVEIFGEGNFNKSLQFVSDFIDSFTISANDTYVGLTVFSDKPHLVFNFSRYDNSRDAVAAVYRSTYPNQGRQIGKALSFAANDFFSKSIIQRGVPNYLIFLTNGGSYDSVSAPTKALQDKNVTVFAVGVGNDYEVEELKAITGNNEGRVFQSTFSRLEDVRMKIREEICICKFSDFDRVRV